MITKEAVLDRLRKVIDPETGMDVVSMGLIREAETYPGGDLKVVFRPSSFTCPLAFHLAFTIQRELRWLSGVRKVDLRVVDFADEEKLNRLLRGEFEERTSRGEGFPQGLGEGKPGRGRGKERMLRVIERVFGRRGGIA